MKKEYGNKLKTLYRKNWLLFFFSLILLFTGILCFQTLYIEISVIGLILCCISIYFICYLMKTYIIVYDEGFFISEFLNYQLWIPCSEIDKIEIEKRKKEIGFYLTFETYYHFMKEPYSILFTLSLNDYFHSNFLLDKIKELSLQK